ncbi:MAG: DUF2971 domain-containing protein [Prolixibacteraceae bacterium]|nr:DUF2971 domain-containing protein [Prolixibacteraceae bacterium]
MNEIKTFPTKTKEETRIHKVEVKNKISIPSIEYVNINHQVPKELIKYYRANELGYKVLNEGKIWASHPLSFNDPFDCPIQMWNKNDFPVEFAKRHIEIIKEELKKNGIILNERQNLKSVESIRKYYFDLVLKCLGIFCLNDNKNSELFWGYYNDHEGISVVFDTNILSFDWNMKPLKVEYVSVEDFQKISLISEEVESNDFLPKVVRWTTLKKSNWIHENEWRYIFLDIIYPYEETRLKEYSEKAIKEIILGYKFFNDQIKDNRDRVQPNNIITYEIKPQDNQYKLHILSHVYEKGINLYKVELSEEFELTKRKIDILEIKANKVTIFYTDIIKYL